MNKKIFTLLLTMLMSIVGLQAFAHDIEDQYQGTTFYYKWINNNTELQVTYRGSSEYEYTYWYGGEIRIPGSVTYNGQTYNVTSIGRHAFYNCNISRVFLPDNVTEINDFAFEGSNISQFSCSANLTKIGKGVFHDCIYLSDITLKDKVIDIGGSIANGNTELAVWSTNKNYSSYYNYAIYEKSSNKLVSACDLFPSSIPSYFTGIGAYAFYGVSLTSLTVPSTVSNIDEYAFAGCKINSVILPTGLTSIGNCVFYGARFTSIEIPNTVTSIGSEAFANSKLISITIPNSVTSIGNHAFISCYDLTSVTIGYSVTDIGRQAFDYCSSLTSVTIGNSVTSIGESAFQHCSSLTEVTVEKKTPITISTTTFGNRANATLYVPLGCKEAYEAANVWKGFKEIKEIGKDMSSSDITINPISAVTYNGSAKMPTVIVKDGTMTLVNGTDYTVSYSNNINAGTATVTITGKGSYTGAKTANFTINPKNASNLTISDIAAVTYTGSAQTPTVTVLDGTTTLTSGTDYTVAYSDNVNAGTATVTITGSGNYTGTKSDNFTINKAPLTITANSYTINKGDALPAFAVSYSGFQNGETSSVLTTQPTISCAATSTSAPGTYDINVSGAVADNYSMTYVKGTLTISAKSVSSLTINSIDAVTYNGLAQTPIVTVKEGNTTLTEGTDYTVAYSNNTNAGTASVTITGSGNYIGTKSANFTINKALLTITANSYTINKGDALPAFAVSYSGLVNSETSSVLTTQPTITCGATDSETAGVFDITPSGAVATNYSFNYVKGTLTVNSTTPPADLAYVDLGLPSGTKWANMNVGANAIEEAGYKFAWGETVTKDEFTVNNYKFGSSASNLTKYNFTDGLTVLQAEDDAATVNFGAGWRIPTKEEWTELKNNCTKQWTTVNGIYGYRFTGSNGNSIFLPVWRTTSWMGGAGSYWTSTLGNDICDAFDIDFDGGGFYIDDSHTAGDISRSWDRNVRAVYDNQSSTLTVSSIDAVTYNGLAQTPTVTVKEGNTTLTEGTDYTVAYSNNTNAGTATVTITGSGNYTGTTTANFTINKAPLTITANSYTINKDDALPAFAVSYSGFQNGETSSVLTTQPTIICDATDSETAGVFDITPSGAVADNYSMTYVKGTLTIEATSVNITLNYLGIGTYCSEYPLDFTDVSGIDANIISGFKPSTGKLILTSAYEVPAGTGLYIIGTPGTTYNIPVKETDFYYSNLMKGVLVNSTIPTYEGSYTNYVLVPYGSDGVIFARANDASLSANRAYVQIPTSIVGAREFLDIEKDDDNTTGLDGVFTSDTKEAEGDYYNLSGQKVQTPQRGLYIKNGKKIFIH